MSVQRLILVTGGSGYVARCLVPALLEKGYPVRVLVRKEAALSACPWKEQVQITIADLLDPPALERALQGVSAAYYLVHNMASGHGYTERELESARSFANFAARAGLEHIIYLGGLADPAGRIGAHLRSRLRTGDVLRSGPVPVTEFRASLIIGSGSISFEMIRYLTEQLPLALGRTWVRNQSQAIAIRNVIDYLLLALENPKSRGRVYEIGGKDRLTYAETMLVYARARGLRRKIVALPWVPVGLMASLAGSLTHVPASIAGPLIEGMRSDSTVQDDHARQDFPEVQLLGFREAVEQSLAQLSPDFLQVAWENGESLVRIKREGFFVEAQRLDVPASAEAVFYAITRLGGSNGWLFLHPLWKLRGLLDGFLGGVGMRGRANPADLKQGDVLDFYRVDRIEPGRLLRLKAELRAPGQGWMEWRVSPGSADSTILEQIAYFAPRGLLGFLYWYGLLPLHRLVFSGLIKALCRQAAGFRTK